MQKKVSLNKDLNVYNLNPKFQYCFFKRLMLFVYGALFLLINHSSDAQSKYPQDYFRNPLDIPLVLSGTFGELRSSHFHSGLDIKTQQKQGLKVYTAAEGYVSRIKISRYGYGKALYITHPNGYTSVYAHLKKFSEKIEAYIKKLQYEKESFEIEVFPNIDELKITSNEVVAYSGNTGGSGGPHLHFEIRDNEERPINPMLFGIDIKDTRKPFVSAVYAYPSDNTSHINGKNKRTKLRLIPKKNGNYEVEQILASGTIGFGVTSYDKQDYAPNNNGVSRIKTYYNGNESLEINFKRFSFRESKHIKRLIDYEFFKAKKSRIQKLFIQENNPLSLYTDFDSKGFVKIEDSTASVYKIKITDFKKNETWVTIPIKANYKLVKTTNDSIPIDKTLIAQSKTTNLKQDNYVIDIFPNTVYEDVHIDFKVSGDTAYIHKDNIPLQKNFNISYDISNYKSEHRNRLFIARLHGYYKKPNYVQTKRKGDVLSASTKIFGTYSIAIDTIAPKIEPINFQNNKWLSKYRYLKLKVNDKLAGISKYRVTVNGKWLLMEYDYKTGILTHDFNDGIVTDTKNNLKLIVTDNVGNSSTFDATFYRK